MPASRSPSPNKPRPYGAWIAAGALAALAVAVVAVPASLAGRVLPPAVRASDFSGSLWHGAAGRVVVRGLDIGAVEWRLHPADLLRLRLGFDATWARGSFALSATGSAGSGSLDLTAVSGGGALEDVAGLTGMAGWRGTARVALSRLTLSPDGPAALAGDIGVSDLHSANVGNDADLGGYALHFDAPAGDGTGAIVGQLGDTGSGPLQLQGTVTLSPHDHAGTLAGNVRARPGTPQALRDSLEQLAQLRPRDADGSLPLDVEFSW